VLLGSLSPMNAGFGTVIWDNTANSIQFREDSRSSHRRIASEPSQVRWRAGRGTMHLRTSEGHRAGNISSWK
jgi:hypothetical protein